MKQIATQPAVWQLQHAKNRFSEVVDRALEGTPQLVTRRGKPAVCVVSAADYQGLVSRSGRSAKEILRSCPHPEVKLELSRDRSPGREIEL